VELLRDYLPAGQEFVIRNLNAMVNSRHRVQVVSLIILLVTSSGVFMPLEVALNRIWRFPNKRSYFGNQLILARPGLQLRRAVSAFHCHDCRERSFAEFLLRGHGSGFIRLVGFVVMKLFAIAASIAIFFLIYWVLPNGKVPARTVLSYRHHYGIAIGGVEVWLHPGAALAQFRRSLRPLRAFGQYDVLGVSFRIAAARRANLSAESTCGGRFSGEFIRTPGLQR